MKDPYLEHTDVFGCSPQTRNPEPLLGSLVFGKECCPNADCWDGSKFTYAHCPRPNLVAGLRVAALCSMV